MVLVTKDGIGREAQERDLDKWLERGYKVVKKATKPNAKDKKNK